MCEAMVMVNILDSMFLTFLKFSGVSGVDQLEQFCSRYNYAPSVVLTEAIKAYLNAVSKFEQQKAEEQLGVKPKITVGVNV
jgi:predicted metal-dependent TIM-barrel fold hydrolase